MVGTSAARGCHCEFARIGLRIGDQLRNCLDWNGWMHRHDERSAGDCDHRKVTDEIETQLFVKGGIDRGGCVSPEQRIAIGWRTDDGLRRDVSGGSGPVFNDKGLTEPRGEHLTHEPYENV